MAGYRISHFESVFHKTHHEIRNSLYTFRISCEFCVLLMPWKCKPWNLLSFCLNDPGVKCEKRKKGCEIPRYILFVFCISRPFRDKCIAGLWTHQKIPSHSSLLCSTFFTIWTHQYERVLTLLYPFTWVQPGMEMKPMFAVYKLHPALREWLS